MAYVRFGDRTFGAGLVAFDKDGTLIDFEFMWGRLAEAWAEYLATGDDAEMIRQALFRAWGYDAEHKRTRPQSPLAIASNPQILTVGAATLYLHGTPWPEAEEQAWAAFRHAQHRSDLAVANLVRPAGDVAGLLQQLHQAGVMVAVVTTDDRAATEAALQHLGVRHLVDVVVAGDDGLAVKPAPDMLLAACRRLEIAPSESVVVGDTEGDLLMAGRAGAGLKVGVLSGVGAPARLAALADTVLNSIDSIAVVDYDDQAP